MEFSKAPERLPKILRGIKLSGSGVIKSGAHQHPSRQERSQFFCLWSLLKTFRRLITLRWGRVVIPSIHRFRPALWPMTDHPVAAGGHESPWDAIGMTVVAAALVISRWVLFPKYLLSFDEVNFALSIDRFDPRIDQPQAPGYPVFVALLKLLALIVPKVEWVFFLSGVLVSAAALYFTWKLCERIIGPGSGIIGAILLLFNPVFWLAALTNPVRLCFAAGSVTVALCLWLACEKHSPAWFVLGAAVLGFAAGARPSLVVIMAPLILWVGWRLRIRLKTIAAALFASAAAVALWFPELLAASGGFRTFLRMLHEYSRAQMGGTSLVFGAPLAYALGMVWEAVSWSCLGALSWIWAAPFVKSWRGPWAFWAIWFFPGLAFYAIFHVADPDHTLSIVPATCVAGAFVLAQMTRQFAVHTRITLFIGLALLNVILFLKPISVVTKPATYKPVQWKNAFISQVIEGVGSLRGADPLTVVFQADVIGWRHLSYYDPDLRLIVFARERDRLWIREITGRRASDRIVRNSTISLPTRGTAAWIDPDTPPLVLNGPPVRATHSHVFYVRLLPGDSFEYDHVRFVAGEKTSHVSAFVPK